ncbi:MAG: T9SS C-terminal target domain-containing protein [Saprospirales bacterium]|nr:MAG: T9SS C-terminal target domain-containing protein [Saprospirales bacterium]
MKTILLLFLSVIFVLQLSAQDVITLPKLGDTNETYQFRSATGGSVDLSASGLGSVWDLTEIDPDSILPGIQLNYYIALEDAPFNDLFESADYVLVEEADGIREYTYIENATDRLLILGTHSESEMAPAVFPEPVLLSLLPVGFMDEETQTAPFVLDLLDEPDTLEVTLSFIADSYGTLLLPNGLVIENALKFSNTTSFNTLFDVEDDELGEITVRVVGNFGTTQILSNDYGVPVLSRTSQGADIFLVVIENVIEIPVQSFEFPTTVEFLWEEPSSLTNRLFEGELNAWPNPVQNILYLSAGDRFSGEPVDIFIFDSMGKMVLQKKADGLGSKFQLEVSDLVPGFYQLLIHNNGHYFTERLIVQ